MTGLKSRRGTAVAAAWLATCLIGAGDCRAQSLFIIPTNSPPSAAVADDEPLRIGLTVREPERLARVLGVKSPAAGTNTLVYVMNGYRPLEEAKTDRWTSPTFVIDYGEPSVVEAGAEFRKTLPGGATLQAETASSLVTFVNGFVRASYARDFGVASEVAVRREGDCKAYAVLTVALARAAGIPARVIIGMALLRKGSEYRAFGHAWAELQIAGRWIVADAALANSHEPVRYLPFGILQNEGMGYTLDLARLTTVWAQRVEVLGRPPSASITH
jgi:hypothetical protein